MEQHERVNGHRTDLTNEEPFDGFSLPNYTQVPDELFDRLLPKLSGAELKVLLYIMRRTFGFKKADDNISLNQLCRGIITRDGKVLDQGTGLSQSTTLVALKGLVKKRAIVSTRRMSKERGNEPTTYRLNLKGTFPENRGRGGPKIGEGLPRKSGTQETVEQDTEIVNVNGFQKSSRNRPLEQRSLPTEDPDTHLRQEALVAEMLSILGDQHSRGFYTQLARSLPDDLIWRALSETKGEAAMGRIKKSRGAYFTTAITKMASEMGYPLNLKRRELA